MHFVDFFSNVQHAIALLSKFQGKWLESQMKTVYCEVHGGSRHWGFGGIQMAIIRWYHPDIHRDHNWPFTWPNSILSWQIGWNKSVIEHVDGKFFMKYRIEKYVTFRTFHYFHFQPIKQCFIYGYKVYFFVTNSRRVIVRDFKYIFQKSEVIKVLWKTK